MPRPVHVTILSRKLGIYTTRRLAQAARMRGARVRVLDPLGVEMHLEERAAAFYRQRKLPATDVVVPRIAPSIQAYGLAVVNHFSMMGVPTLNDAASIATSRNKMRSLLTMLGVIIGVASVVALLSVGQGASAAITGQVSALGTNMLTIVKRPETRAV